MTPTHRLLNATAISLHKCVPFLNFSVAPTEPEFVLDKRDVYYHPLAANHGGVAHSEKGAVVEYCIVTLRLMRVGSRA